MNWKNVTWKMTRKKKKAVKMLNTVMAMDTAEMMMEPVWNATYPPTPMNESMVQLRSLSESTSHSFSCTGRDHQYILKSPSVVLVVAAV